MPLAAYLLGGVPFGLLVVRFSGAGDIRLQGSGNIGATNVLRAAGRGAGGVALLLDMAKGGLAVGVAGWFMGAETVGTAMTALAVFLGHLFPVWLGFKGGKGVATGLGVFLVWSPVAGLGAACVWLAVAALFRISSVASLGAFMVVPIMLFFQGPVVAWFAALVMVPLIIWRHWPNIRRLQAGTEPRIGKKGEEK